MAVDDTTGSSSSDDGPPLDSSESDSAPAESTGTTGTTETTETTETTGPDETGIVPGCGNGVVDEDEACDDDGESATCNADCTAAMCGDGVLNAAAGEDCDDQGPSEACDSDCTAAACGDDTRNALAGEECDGTDLGVGTCEDLGFDMGTLACAADCTYETSECALLPDAPVLALSFSPVKQFEFSWAAAGGADYYQLEESAAPGEPFVQLGLDVAGLSVSHTMPLYLRHEASYRLRACNAGGCTDSAVLDVMSSLVEAVGYFKASNTGSGDQFGASVALSGDGNTLAVGATGESSGATGIGGDQASDAAAQAGAVYVFVRDGMGGWSQQAYIKASNASMNDQFGFSVGLSDDGDTLAVSAIGEDSNATGIGGNQADDSTSQAGAVYVFARDGMDAWSQAAYVKASNPGSGDGFGRSLALSGDGDTLAVGADAEDSDAVGIDGDQAANVLGSAGAAYVYVRDGLGGWSQQAYIKASNTGELDFFGNNMALSDDGDTLAVGAYGEGSNATGIDGDGGNDLAPSSGAVYVYVRDGMGGWSQEAYVKASNTSASDSFGRGVALSGDGNTLAAGAYFEASNATGIDGDQGNDLTPFSGAAYVFVRDGMGEWSQEAYVKTSNPGSEDYFGAAMVLSDDGNTFLVGAFGERSSASGVGVDELDDSASQAGAVYAYVRDGLGGWSQRAYVKASNTDASDRFGNRVALSGDGRTFATGAFSERSAATGIDGDQLDDSTVNAGAVYVY